jgi:predicted PurR-regulated permease PerM
MVTSPAVRAAAQEPTGEQPASSGLNRPLVLLLGTAGVVVAAAGIRAGAEIVAPTMLALVLTIAVLPITHWARGRGLPGWLGILIALVAAYAIVLVLLLGLSLAVVKLVDLLPQYAEDARALQDDGATFLADLGIGADSASTMTDQLDPAKLTDLLTTVLNSLLSVLGNLFFLVTVLFFFCTAITLAGPRVATLDRTRPDVARSLRRFVDATQRYLVVTALFGAIVAVLDTGALWLLGVPLPLVWGLFSFITNFIPNIGFVIGVIPPALLALLEDGWAKSLTVILVYSGLNVVIQTFIQPHYVGATVGLSAEMTFLSLVVWTFLLGALGALLAVPMTLLVRALLIDPDTRMAWVTPLIATTPDPEPEPEPQPGPEAEADAEPQPVGD